MVAVKMTKKEFIKNTLDQAISSGKYSPGQKIAGEHQLALEHGVSRLTIRGALDDLARIGKIVRYRGSGTFVSSENLKNTIPQNSQAFHRNELDKVPHTPPEITVGVPIHDPKKILIKHFWGKFVEHSHQTPQKVHLRQVQHKISNPGWEVHKTVVKMFTSPNPIGLFEITMSDLGWLVDTGLCEDLTDRFPTWSQKDNLYPVAMDAATYKNRIYGLPFHSTLYGFVYNKDWFERLGIDPREPTSSLEGLVRTVEKFARREECQYAFYAVVRTFVMILLRAYYDDLWTRFCTEVPCPIEKPVALEILQLLHRLKWKNRALFNISSEVASERNQNSWGNKRSMLATGAIPMGAENLLPKAEFDLIGAKDQIAFTPFSFCRQGRPFSIFNSYVWIINPLVDKPTREFLWTFLQDYVAPQSEYELDRRHVEENSINDRTNSFIQVPPRVPNDPDYERQRQAMFGMAEREIPFPNPVFDRFIDAVRRILFDSEADMENEYLFYQATCEMGRSENQEGIFSTARK